MRCSTAGLYSCRMVPYIYRCGVYNIYIYTHHICIPWHMRKLYIFVLLEFPYWLQTSVESFRHVRACQGTPQELCRGRLREAKGWEKARHCWAWGVAIFISNIGNEGHNPPKLGGHVPKCWIGRSNLWWFKNEQIEAEVFNRWMEWWTVCLDQPLLWQFFHPDTFLFRYETRCQNILDDLTVTHTHLHVHALFQMCRVEMCWTFSTTTWLEKQAVPEARKANVCK